MKYLDKSMTLKINEHNKKLPVLLAIFAILLNLSFLSCKDDESPEDITIEVPDEGVVEKAAFVDIPDPNFRAYLKKTIPKAFPNGGNKIDPQHSMVKGLTILDVKDKRIKSLSGIQYFISLEELYCSNNVLDTLDLTGNTALTRLDCSESKLRKLILAHNTVSVNIQHNQLKHLDVSQNKALKELVCSHNQLTALDLKNNTALTSLTCDDNQLKHLDVSQNKALKKLVCSHNQLTALNLKNNTALTSLTCYDNQLENLDLRGISPSEGKAIPNLYIIDEVESHRKDDKSITALKTIKINDAFKNVSNSFHDQLSYIKEKNPKVVISNYDKQGNPILEDYNPLAEKRETKSYTSTGIVINTLYDFFAPLNREHITDWQKQISPDDIDGWTKFDFSTGEKVDENSPDWDVAFSGHFIIVNGGEKTEGFKKEPERTGKAAGAILTDTTFEEVTDVSEVEWRQDTAEEHAIDEDVMSKEKGVFSYNFPKHLVYTIKDRVLVFRTCEGKYAKMQILSYYQGFKKEEDIPVRSYDFGYYTFQYAYNPSGDTNLDTSKASKQLIKQKAL